MGIKTNLVAASGGTASGGAIDVACRLAQRFCAYLEGYHARLDIPGDLLAVDVDRDLHSGHASCSRARAVARLSARLVRTPAR